MGNESLYNQIERGNLHAVHSPRDAIVAERKKDLAKELSGDGEKMKGIDKIQLTLDALGLDPTMTLGTAADATNAVISLCRAALAEESDMRKKHLLNFVISSISLMPFGDVVKLLKLRKTPKIAKAYITGARAAQGYAKKQKMQGDRYGGPSKKLEIPTNSHEGSTVDTYQKKAA